MDNPFVSGAARIAFILFIPGLALLVVAGIAQLSLSWRHRNEPPMVLCDRCALVHRKGPCPNRR